MNAVYRTRRAGFTLLEVLLALTLTSIVVFKVASVMTQVQEVSSTASTEAVLQDKTQIALEHIARAVMGSSRESLLPDAEQPSSSSELQFQINLGLDEGEIVWSDPERIWLSEDSSSVFWGSVPEGSPERYVAWTNLAREFLEGELPNGMDDNGNGLIDEKGLSFTVDRNAVSIRLSLETTNADGKTIVHTAETTVTCRNLEPSQ